MNRIQQRYIPFVVALVLAAFTFQASARATTPDGFPVVEHPRVLIVSFDGLRPDAITAATAPTLTDLIASGSYDAAALAEIPAVTLPNHLCMVTGLTILNHGVLANFDLPGRTQHTTIFDAAEAAGLRTAYFATKSKLAYLCNEGETDAWDIESDVDTLADIAAGAIADTAFDLVFLHFGEPDGTGHAHGWMSDPYLEKVTSTDAAFARVLTALDNSGARDETLIIVTADHGGTGRTHGFPIATDQHVPFILSGPQVAVGRELDARLRPMDVAATALGFLGVDAEFARDGRFVSAAFETSAADEIEPDPNALLAFPCGPLPLFFVGVMAVGLYRVKRRPLS